jgi:hypothetical protein
MYTNIMTYVRVCDGKSYVFSIKIELHQGTVLNLYIFILEIDEITNDIQQDIP